MQDEKYVFVFVRQDIPVQHQGVQSQHAILHMATDYNCVSGIPNIVWIGVKNLNALNKVLRKLKDNQIPHRPWVEPDDDMGFTAIATVPISSDQKTVLKEYQVWKHKFGENGLPQNNPDTLSGGLPTSSPLI